MLEKLGPRRYALPLAVIVAMACAMALAFYPVAHMEVKGLPFAVLSLDEGVETPQGTVCAGGRMAEALAAQDSEEATVAWQVVESQEDLDAALDSGEYYGALVIPADYTASMMAAQMGAAPGAAALGGEPAGALGGARAEAANGAAEAGAAGAAGAAGSTGIGAAAPSAAAPDAASNEAPAVLLLIDNAKSPLVANLLQANLPALTAHMGVETEVQILHAEKAENGDEEGPDAAAGGVSNPFIAVMGQQLVILPLYLMSAVCAALVAIATRTKSGSAAAQFKTVGIQAGMAVGFSLLVSAAVLCLANGVLALEAPLAECGLFFWLASLGIMLALIGLFDIALPLGALGVICSFGGMMCGILSFELLPAFWQDAIFPWAPQRFVGEGLRAILYLDAGAWNGASDGFAVAALAGVALMCCAAAFFAWRERKKAQRRQTAADPTDAA